MVWPSYNARKLKPIELRSVPNSESRHHYSSRKSDAKTDYYNKHFFQEQYYLADPRTVGD